jgi:hypothetical protein
MLGNPGESGHGIAKPFGMTTMRSTILAGIDCLHRNPVRRGLVKSAVDLAKFLGESR